MRCVFVIQRRPSYVRGMTLLEVLVAFVVLALITGTAMEVFSSGARTTVRVVDEERAIALAESRLAVVGATVREPGEWEGQWNGYSWHALADDVTPAAFSTVADRIRLFRITVTVAWRDNGQMRAKRLTSLRVAPGSQAEADG